MATVSFSHRGECRWLWTARFCWSFGVALALLDSGGVCSELDRPGASIRLERPFVVTQLPADRELGKRGPIAGGVLRASYGEGARLVLVAPDGTRRVLKSGFHSAADPNVSFDGTHLLFAAKRAASDHWNIYEMAVDGSGLRQITRDLGDCRSPSYQSTLYTMPPPTVVAPAPRHQITFVSNLAGSRNEYGGAAATHLYSSKLDGSAQRRLTFNLSSDVDPITLPDGRILFASWQRSRLDHGLLGRVGLFGINIDGTDFALSAGYEGPRVKHMPCVTAGGLIVFVEADQVPWDGAGRLACVTLRRPLHSYRQITEESAGLYHTPSPLPDGRILVSRRPRDGSRTHGVWRLDPVSGEAEPVFDDPRYHDVQAKCIYPRQEPDGRSSVVTEEDPHGRLYCLNVYTSDLEGPNRMAPGSVKRIRVLEGVPLEAAATPTVGVSPSGGKDRLKPGLHRANAPVGIPPLARRRILGEIPVQEDGSFNVVIPANTPVELQILDADGMALRSCGWIWAKNREPRGCIGCHEDGELVPENGFVDAAREASVELCPPLKERRSVDFRRDVMPILAAKCVKCHGREEKTPLYLGGDVPRGASRRGATGVSPVPGGRGQDARGTRRSYENLLAPAAREGDSPIFPAGKSGQSPSHFPAALKYVHPGRARTSPLVWHLFGRNTARPWDGAAQREPVKRMPPDDSAPLDEKEKRTLVEWIDTGALWEGIHAAENAERRENEGKAP